MKQKQIIKYIEKMIYYIIPICLYFLYIQTIFTNSIWLDEAFSMSMIQQNFGEMIYNTAIDVHPPLYYIILKILVGIFEICLGNTIWTAKIVSIIPIGILLIIGYTILEKMYGKKTVFLFQLFILSVPQIMNYAIEIRMYTWGLLFVTLFYLYCIKWKMENKKIDRGFMTLFAILAAYTHYFALVPVACIYLYLLIETIIHNNKEQTKAIINSILICCIAYLGWIIVWLNQVIAVKDSYWIGEITWESFLSYFKFLFFVDGKPVLTWILIGILLLAILTLWTNRKEKDSKIIFLGLTIPIGTIMIGVIASKLLRPIFIERYLVPSLGVLWMSVAISLGKYCKRKTTFVFLSIIILIIGSTNLYKLVNIEQQYSKKTNETLSFIDKISNSVFLFDNNQLQRVVAYYYHKTQTYVYNKDITDLTKKVYRQTKMDKIENLEEIKNIEQEIYVFVIEDEILDELASLGYMYEIYGNYNIEHYVFSIYKIKN